MKPCPWPMTLLLPHAPPMVLLDEVVSYDDDRLAAVATIADGHPFLDGEKVPAHVGIELMAQTCGAYAGIQALVAGNPVSPGFLLGTRGFTSRTSHFRRGDRLEIAAVVVFRDAEMASFDCEIRLDGAVVAEARLNLHQPKRMPGVQGGV